MPIDIKLKLSTAKGKWDHWEGEEQKAAEKLVFHSNICSKFSSDWHRSQTCHNFAFSAFVPFHNVKKLQLWQAWIQTFQMHALLKIHDPAQSKLLDVSQRFRGLWGNKSCAGFVYSSQETVTESVGYALVHRHASFTIFNALFLIVFLWRVWAIGLDIRTDPKSQEISWSMNTVWNFLIQNTLSSHLKSKSPH